jgi:uncharacterized protein YdeI (YjbR/CyaY-like superfamily)
MKRDQRIDDYIARQADFAWPILEHLRERVHSACPDAEETLKWGMPSFMYKGEILASMAAFKAHASFSLWRGKEVLGEGEAQDGAMGQFGRLRSVEDLPPPEELDALIQRAMSLAGTGAKRPRTAAPKPPPQVPPDLEAALGQNPAAAATFEAFPPSCRREYVEWVIQAKRPETRERRIAQAIEWMAEGKRRNWKYENC